MIRLSLATLAAISLIAILFVIGASLDRPQAPAESPYNDVSTFWAR